MNYHKLLDIVTELGYQLAMCGAETFRVEESISRILSAYGIHAEAFAITNCLTVSITTPEGDSLTRMRRIGFHGNDLDSVERYNSLSRRICAEIPQPEIAFQWLEQANRSRIFYSLPVLLLGNFMGAFGYAVFFGGSWVDAIFSGVCGILVGIVNRIMSNLKVNPFFSTIAAAFIMAFAAYGMGIAGFTKNTDAVIIGTLMILVPGLIFTNAMRDIIFGDTNSGINRIVQVFMIAAAIALGTGSAWNLSEILWGTPVSVAAINHSFFIQCLAAGIGCVGFSIIFNIHGPGTPLCALGGMITWASYLLCFRFTGNEPFSYFISSLIAAAYAETMARIRKYPAISYLVVSVFPLIPGAGIYYATSFLVLGDMANFSSKSIQTVAAAGAIAVGILFLSTLVKLYGVWKETRKKQ